MSGLDLHQLGALDSVHSAYSPGKGAASSPAGCKETAPLLPVLRTPRTAPELARERGAGSTRAEAHRVGVRAQNLFLQVEHRFGAVATEGEFELPLHSKAETQAQRGKKGDAIFFSGRNRIRWVSLCTS